MKSTIKKVIETEVLLCYPDFNKPFYLYTDASDHQLGAVIMQDKKLIAFYSRNPNTAQKRYTTIERIRELLSAIETYKEYKNILLGYPIIVFKTKRIIPSMVKSFRPRFAFMLAFTP
jgi:hypothetical protein